mmetsp:Transcript_32138/g.42797  ORF Transcript_32138/g.42797 Transcript_32138/m.42797 type:complete len:80 (+) Transcript_32138:359-598(+)
MFCYFRLYCANILRCKWVVFFCDAVNAGTERGRPREEDALLRIPQQLEQQQKQVERQQPQKVLRRVQAQMGSPSLQPQR